jgi:hypothetical protein
VASRAAARDLGSLDPGQFSYGLFTILPSVRVGGRPPDRPHFWCPHIQYDEGTAEETCKVDLDSIEEHRVAALMRHTHHKQQLRRYHDRNVREWSFNMGDLVLRRIQDTKGMHKLSVPWEGPSL